MTARKKMARKTLKDLKSKTKRFTIKHPDCADVETWVEMSQPKTHRYFESLCEYQALIGDDTTTKLNMADNLKASSIIISGYITDWDEEFFCMKPDTDNIREVFGDYENQWLIEAVNTYIAEEEAFFRQ